MVLSSMILFPGGAAERRSERLLAEFLETGICFVALSLTPALSRLEGGTAVGLCTDRKRSE